MSKRMALMIGLALAAMPGTGSAQDVGASFTVRERPAQPGLVASSAPGASAAVAHVPGGWAYSVSRGPGGAAGAPRLPTGILRSDRLEVALPPIVAGSGGEPVTVTFVPL